MEASHAGCDSLVTKTDAVRPLTEEEFRSLAVDPTQKIELIPGRALFAVKAPAGRLKAWVVACGNFQCSASRGREDTFACRRSAPFALPCSSRRIGRRSPRRENSLSERACHHAKEKVIVRVPAIMRMAGICTEKYWLVQKAMYGLDVAPRSLSLHRNCVLQSITALKNGTEVEVRPLDEDVNLWRVSRKEDNATITWLALYVDMLLVGKTAWAQKVAETLRSLWSTSPVQWATETETLTFNGFEVKRKHSHVLELLGMYESIQGNSAF